MKQTMLAFLRAPGVVIRGLTLSSSMSDRASCFYIKCNNRFGTQYVQKTVNYLNLFTDFNLLSFVHVSRDIDNFVRANELSDTHFSS